MGVVEVCGRRNIRSIGAALAHPEVGGHLWQKTHGDELGESDAEAADGEGDEPRGMRSLLLHWAR